MSTDSILRLAKSANRYGSYINAEETADILDLLERLHAAGDVDLKAPTTSGISKRVEGATFPVAILGVGAPDLEFFDRLGRMDPACLGVSSRGMPSFIDAVKSHVRIGEDRTTDTGLNESIDDILAFWARSIPVEQLKWLDEPGDDPGAGLIGHIRSVGAFPELQRALSDLGFDPNAKRSGSIPTASSIASLSQLQAFMDNGGDLNEIVPVPWPNRPDGVALWEYIFEPQNHPGGAHEMLKAIGVWCEQEGGATAAEFSEKMYWWHLRQAANKNKDSLLEFLREHPGWADRRDGLGRNALHIAGRLCPPFLNHILNSKTLSHLLDEKDSMGHGAAGHVLPALAAYNRASDAKKMAASLLRRRGRLRDFDENNECGLVISYALDYIAQGQSSLPSPVPLFSNRNRSDVLPSPGLWIATTEQYEAVAELMVQGLSGRRTPGASVVIACASKLFKEACAAAAVVPGHYSGRDNDDKEQAARLFAAMPNRLQQAIAMAAIKLADPTTKGTYGSNPVPLEINLENERVRLWVLSILGRIEIDVPEAYIAKQAATLALWEKNPPTPRIQACGDVLRVAAASAQASALRSGITAPPDQEKGLDSAATRPAARF